MRHSGLVFLIVIMLIFEARAEPSQAGERVDPYAFLVGVYTDHQDQGIELLSFNPRSMMLTSKVIAAGVNNPSFVIGNRARNLVFSVEDTAGERGGKVKSFAFDRQAESLELLSTADTFGAHPCYLSLDPSERFLVAGNYVSGNFSVYEISDGMLKHVQTIQHKGRSANKQRQGSAHVHSAVFHPDGKQMLVADLGTDRIHIYDFHPEQPQPFSPANPADFRVKPGSGPRHMVIHPDGSQLYLIYELTAQLGVYAYDNGKISQSQIVSLTDKRFFGDVQAAEVRISPDGKFLYASNRGDANQISVFEIGMDGVVSLIQTISSGGRTPRNFNLTSDGRFLLAANQDSNDIHVFERDAPTGRLQPTALKLGVNKPVYLFPLN
ncbi:6-phosphogluconolactonase [Methylophilaceae bacterium]|nr:6-phosphogluconolactonase [Methylophilaceae bacterium]